MENYFARLPRLKGFLDLRSYGQMCTCISMMAHGIFFTGSSLAVSTPFSYSCKKSPKDAEDQLEAISGAAHAMKKSHGTLFTVSPCVSFLRMVIGHTRYLLDGGVVFDTIQVSWMNESSRTRGAFQRQWSFLEPPGT